MITAIDNSRVWFVYCLPPSTFYWLALGMSFSLLDTSPTADVQSMFVVWLNESPGLILPACSYISLWRRACSSQIFFSFAWLFKTKKWSSCPNSSEIQITALARIPDLQSYTLMCASFNHRVRKRCCAGCGRKCGGKVHGVSDSAASRRWHPSGHVQNEIKRWQLCPHF